MGFLAAKIFALWIFVSSFLPQQTFTEGLVGQPQHLNPLNVGANSVDRDITRLIFRGLMKYDASGDLVTDLAEKYQISEDRKEYTLDLRKGVFWHDGVELTTDDILYTASQHPQLKALQVDKLDRYRVRFSLRDTYSPFLDLLTLGIAPSHLANSMGDLNPVGTGDYRWARIKKSNKIDEVVLVRANSNRGIKDKSFSRIVFKFYTKPSELITAARLGEVDAFSSDEFVPKFSNFNQYRTPLGSRYYALFINLDYNPDLKNRELRQDIANAIPKEKIVEQVYKGSAVVAHLPLDYTFATASSVKRPLIKEEPTKKYDINLNLTIPNREIHRKTAQIIKKALENIGIHLNLIEVETEGITTGVIAERKFDLLLLGQEIEHDPDVYTLWHSTQKNLPGLNFVNFESVLADKALEEGRKVGTVEERIKHYQNFQKVFVDEVPAVIIYHPIMTYSVKSSIKNISLRGFFKNSDRFMSFPDWFRQD